MMAEHAAIQVHDLSKAYHVYEKPVDYLKEAFVHRLHNLGLIGRHRYHFRKYWALKNVSFQVRKGESVGVIGENGAGKSTLLQLICGTLFPSSGSIQVSGRIGALLELGSGFNYDFTGIENVRMYASMLGLSKKEIDVRLPDICKFADIGEFVYQPLRNYSNGMVVRLAFAALAHVDADILVIDEALAVGDTFFQQKCLRFLHDFQDKGGTILFVTHNTSMVLNLCSKALLLYPGSVIPSTFGDAEELCKKYLENIYNDPLRGKSSPENKEGSMKINGPSCQPVSFDGDLKFDSIYTVSGFRVNADSFGRGGAAIVDAGFFNEDDQRLRTLNGGDSVCFKISVKVYTPIIWPAFGFMLKNSLGEYLYTESTDQHFREHQLVFREGETVTAAFKFSMPHLYQGKYTINVAFAEGLGDDHIQHHWIHDAVQLDVLSSRVAHGFSGMSKIQMKIDIFPNFHQ